MNSDEPRARRADTSEVIRFDAATLGAKIAAKEVSSTEATRACLDQIAQTDDEYHAKLRAALPTVLASSPDIVFYLAGADPFEGDQLGGLGLTRAGLLERDRMVFDACASADRAVVVTLAGGYARRLEDTVAIHCATIELAARTFTERRGPF